MAESCVTSSLTQEDKSSGNFELSPSGSLPSIDDSEMGDLNEYTCIEQEVYILDLMQKEFPVTLHTQCVLCHAIFSTRQLSKEHFETAHGGKLFECRFCRLTFVMEDNLQQHYEKHHGLKLVKLKNDLEKNSIEGASHKKLEAHQQEKRLENHTEGDATVSNQNGTHIEGNVSDNNSINENESNVSITIGQPNTFEENSKDTEGYNPKENVQVPDELVSERVSSAKRELKFGVCSNKDEEDKGAKESTPTVKASKHRNLYVQRHNKCLKKLRDVIQERSAAKKKNLKQEKTDKNKPTIQDESQNSNLSNTQDATNCSGIETTDREVRMIDFETETYAFTEESASNDDKSVTVIGSPESINTDKDVAIERSENLDLYQGTGEENVLEETLNMDLSKGTTTVDLSKETEHLDVSKETTNMDVSEGSTNMDLSKKTTNVDLSVETTNVDVSKRSTNVDESEETENMDISAKNTNVDVSIGSTNMDVSKEIINMDVSKEIVNMDVSKEIVNMDVPEETTNETPNDNEPVDIGKEVTDTRAENAKDDRLWCTRCNISFKNKYTLRRHLYSLIHKFNNNAEHPLEREVCYDCASGFANKRNLWKHKTFKCFFRNKSLNASTSDQSRANLMNHTPCKKKEQGITRVHHTGNPDGNSNPHDVAPEEETADKPSNETQKNKSTNSDITMEDQEQRSSQNDHVSREPVPPNGENERLSNSDGAIGCETRVNDSTISASLDGLTAIPRMADQTKTPDREGKSNPTKCNGCGVLFPSRKRCKRHAKNRCAAFKEVQPIPLTRSPEPDANPLVDPRKVSKRFSAAVKESATVEEMPKLHITCKDCGKQFSKRSKYLKHARKHGDLPKLIPEASKTVSIETNPANESTKLESSNPDVDITVRVPDFPSKIFQCLKCYRCFESEIAMKFHMDRFCSGPKIHGSATSSTTTSTTFVPREGDNTLGCSSDITVKCCICLESFSTRTECYRHLSVVHRLSRRKTIELERGYLQQQIRMNFDFMVNRICGCKKEDVIPAVNLGLSWKLETIEFPDVLRTTTSHPNDLRSN